ncbi:hypothetical protein ACFL2D_00200 [Patescibacteria group bacterium]
MEEVWETAKQVFAWITIFGVMAILIYGIHYAGIDQNTGEEKGPWARRKLAEREMSQIRRETRRQELINDHQDASGQRGRVDAYAHLSDRELRQETEIAEAKGKLKSARNRGSRRRSQRSR